MSNPPATQSLASAAALENAASMRSEIIKRLGLWLVVGHGAGLLAFVSKFSELKSDYASIVLPSIWFFAIGLLLSFLMHIAVFAEFDNQVLSITSSTDYKVDKNWKAIGAWSALLSSVAFVGGIFYPLIFVSLAKFDFIGFPTSC